MITNPWCGNATPSGQCVGPDASSKPALSPGRATRAIRLPFQEHSNTTWSLASLMSRCGIASQLPRPGMLHPTACNRSSATENVAVGCSTPVISSSRRCFYRREIVSLDRTRGRQGFFSDRLICLARTPLAKREQVDIPAEDPSSLSKRPKRDQTLSSQPGSWDLIKQFRMKSLPL